MTISKKVKLYKNHQIVNLNIFLKKHRTIYKLIKKQVEIFDNYSL